MFGVIGVPCSYGVKQLNTASEKHFKNGRTKISLSDLNSYTLLVNPDASVLS